MDRETILGVIVTLLAIVPYLAMGAGVAILRGRLGMQAPATTAPPQFERSYRVHLNTAEQYVAFLPLLGTATLTFHAYYWLPAAFGVAFLLARLFYMRLYMSAPETRIRGAFLTVFSEL